MAINLIIYIIVLFGMLSQDQEKHKGFTWVGQHEINKEDIQPLVQTKANWISLVPFGYMRNYNSPEVRMANKRSYYWGESDEGIVTTGNYAKDHGLKVMLKPHVWLINMSDGNWRGTIRMDSQEDWKRWFDSYEQFILYYAKMADEQSYNALCIGTEFHIATKYHAAEWRDLIKKIRTIYKGELTYAANWSMEYEEISFWDDLDYIGIQAYFPISKIHNPEIDDLMAGWQPHKNRISKVSEKYNKQVLFTEIGYKSSADAAVTPWVWPSQTNKTLENIDLQTQSNCYEALFRAFWKEQWFKGVHFWEWYPKHQNAGGKNNIGFTPQNKPALQVLENWW